MDVKDGIIGLAVADALGVPVEFKSREVLKLKPVTDMIGNGTYNQPEGTWSDDTSMVLATLDGVIESGRLDYEQIATNFCLWASGKKYNAHDKLFDIGITTHKSLQNYVTTGVEATKAGCNGIYDNGNGSLMRILPIAYYFKENPCNDYEMADIIDDLSSITHRHEISCMACYLYTKYALSLLDGKDFKEAYEDLKRVDTTMYSKATTNNFKRILSGEIATIENEKDISSSGFVVSSLEAALWCCLKTNNYEEATLKAVNLGEDTDTVAAIAGGLCGIRYGIDNIPSKWQEKLVKRDYIISLADRYQNTIKTMSKDVKELYK
ncbi:MAG: ADP-ribosylglycohydrolase family protein [Bacilli bacterium]|nr:ADP-ribosylglycohydrolase family protein [Bacilli bacterium]